MSESECATCNKKGMLGFKAHCPETNEDPQNNVILTTNICTQAYLIGNEFEDTLL